MGVESLYSVCYAIMVIECVIYIVYIIGIAHIVYNVHVELEV